MAEWSKAHAC